MSKTAVVLYGFLRTFEITSQSLIKNVIEQNKADLFIFAPNISGNLTKYHKSSNKDAQCGEYVSMENLEKVYGNNLKSFHLVEYSEKNILGDIDLSKVADIGDINPIRQVSLFYHIKQSLLLLENYEKKNNIKYDNIVLTRPDIAFYTPLNISDLDLNSINIPKGEGFDRFTGKCREGLASVFYYKNVKDAVCIPGGTYGFSDIIICSKRDNIMHLKNVYDNFQNIMDKQVPCNAETICFYWFNKINNLAIKAELDVIFEIFRPCYKLIETVNDLDGYAEDKTLSKHEKKIYKHLSFYKKYFKIRYLFNKKKRKEKRELIKVLEYRKNRLF